MSSVLEVLGMSLPYSSSTPAVFPGEQQTSGLHEMLEFLYIRKGARVFQGC